MGKLKDQIKKQLLASDFDGLFVGPAKPGKIFKHLISLTYDKEGVLGWRAIEAVGRVTGRMTEGEAREAAERVLWMLRDESGNSAWSGPEMLGEIVRNNPERLADFAPIVGSFHDEWLFTAGVMRAIGRIAEQRPELVSELAPMVAQYLEAGDAAVRGNAVYALGAIGGREHGARLEGMREDSGELVFYEAGELVSTTVGELVQKALGKLG